MIAISYINKMGGVRSEECRKVGFDIWRWAETQQVWLTTSHIPGLENEIAESLSRNFSPSVEWKLNQNIFDSICEEFGTPEMDLFASRHNAKLQNYCSWFSDSYCSKEDAFSFSWSGMFYYIFPPFRLVGKCCQKILMDRTKAILVAPKWPSQTWFATVKENARWVITFPQRRGNVSSPNHSGSGTASTTSKLWLDSFETVF